MVSIPYGAMAGEMTLDKKERSSMTAWRMAFASLGILIGGALIPILAGERDRMNECPLGSAALAGTSFPIDRNQTAKALEFDRPTANSLDAVSDRDFALEFLASSSISTAEGTSAASLNLRRNSCRHPI